jgi:hypothetical protein
MRETRPSGSAGGEAELNRPSLPRSYLPALPLFSIPPLGMGNFIHLIRHTHIFCRKRFRPVGLRNVVQWA